jgi:hypothetical protein
VLPRSRASVRSAPVCVLLFLFIIFYAAKAQTTRESVSGYFLPMRSSFLKMRAACEKH